MDFGRGGYRPALRIYTPDMTPAQVDAIATGRAAPPGSRNVLPPIHIAIRAPGDLFSGKTMQLVDGRHRLEAAQSAGARQMRALISVYGPRGGLKWRGERIIRTPRVDPSNRHQRDGDDGDV